MYERRRFEIELTHLELYAALPKTKTAEREMKFEIQSENVIYKNDGEKRVALGRKWGPDGYLVKDARGAIELQSEAKGFVEFETPKWSHDWCKVKERIQAAVDMVAAINDAPDLATGTKNGKPVRYVKLPFDVKRLGLGANEWLEVEILDIRAAGKPRWKAKIQASESFKLTDFESYLLEHRPDAEVKKILATAKTILTSVNAAMAPADNLYNLLLIIVGYVIWIENSTKYFHDKKMSKLAKEHIYLMSRTSFSWMYRQFLTKDEQVMFKRIVSEKRLLKEMGVNSKTRLFTRGFTGMNSPGPTIHAWLRSIYLSRRDLLSNLGGANRAMGRFPEVKKGMKIKEEDKQLVKFEARYTKKAQTRPVTEWVEFAKEVFSSAYARRGTGLSYDPTKCP